MSFWATDENRKSQEPLLDNIKMEDQEATVLIQVQGAWQLDNGSDKEKRGWTKGTTPKERKSKTWCQG